MMGLPEQEDAMRLTLELDLSTVAEDPAGEAGRILRYWAGALRQIDLTAPAEFPVMDSSYSTRVGTLRVESADD